jgi:putative flippase GtrA
MTLLTRAAQLLHRLRRLLRYATVSVISSTLSLGVLGMLVTTRTLPAGWANVVATAAGTVPSFELNRRWVWGKSGRRSILNEVGPFCAMTFLGLALSTIAVSFASALAASSGFSTGVRTFVIEAANAGAWGSIWLGQFFVLDRVLFADGSQPSSTASTPDSELHRSVSSA